MTNLALKNETSSSNTYPVETKRTYYNPQKRQLRRNNPCFQKGQGLTIAINNLYKLNESIKIFEEKTNIATKNATTFYEGIQLPTLSDYEDLSNLHDIELTEIEIYKASKKFSW